MGRTSKDRFRGNHDGPTNKGESKPGIEVRPNSRLWRFIGLNAPPRPMDDDDVLRADFGLNERVLTHPTLAASSSFEVSESQHLDSEAQVLPADSEIEASDKLVIADAAERMGLGASVGEKALMLAQQFKAED